jgi:hypothetical protein
MYKMIKKAIKALAKIPIEFSARLINAFDAIATENTNGLSIEPLEGFISFRLKIESYRASNSLYNAIIPAVIL